MKVNYNKLWKLLIDKNMKKKELAALSGISVSVLAKIGKNENVTIDILAKICGALNCTLDDIVDLTPITQENIDDQ